MRKLHFADHLEKNLAQALEDANIEFLHESENKIQALDFFLPTFDIYIEVKQYHADRISRQMASRDNVIALQGKKSVDLFINLLSKKQDGIM